MQPFRYTPISQLGCGSALSAAMPPGTIAFNAATRTAVGALYSESGAIKRGISSSGTTVSTAGTTDYINIGRVSKALPGKYTTIIRLIPGTGHSILSGVAHTGATYLEQILINTDTAGAASPGSGRVTLSFRGNDGNMLVAYTAAGVITAGVEVTLAFQLVSTTALRIFVNGVSQSLTYFQTATLVLTAGVTEFTYDLLNSNQRNAHGFGSSQTNVSVFARIPSCSVDVKSLSNNPWQIFSAPASPIFVGFDAAGSGATAAPTGVSATGAVGTPVATGEANAYPAGVVATGAAGTPTAVGGTSIPATGTPTGVSSAWSVGSPVATGAAKALPSGVSVTGAIGTPAATGAAKALLTGVSATGSVGTPIAVAGGSAVATPAGVSANWYVGTPAATGSAVAFPSGVSASSAVGAPVAVAGGAAVALPTGVQAVGSVGTPVAMGAAIAYPLGLAGYWSVGQPVAVVPVAAYWPIPSQVLSGITYGPTGADYTGTATAGGYPSAADIAAAVRAEITPELARIDAAISSRSTVAAIMGATAP